MRVRKGPPDITIFTVALLLTCIGMIMIYSSSAVKADLTMNDAYYFLKKQLMSGVISLFAMTVAMKYNYEKLPKLGTPALFLGLICLVLVLIPGIGLGAKGSTRQIVIGGFNFSPSELAKLCMVFFLASSLSKHLDKIKELTAGILPYLLIIGLYCGLVMLQPDLGTAFTMAAAAFLMLFMAGAKKSHLALMALGGVVLVAAAIALAPYRMVRFISFLAPYKYSQGSGYQIIQSLYAIGSGGLFGVGLGRSRQKFFYLPEQHTDFIFAILGEELGYIGIVVILLLFLTLAWRGFRTALNAPDTFGSLLAAGITTWIVTQACINMGVVSGSLPVTGIPLPFISYGGSSLLFIMTGVGLLLNVSRYCHNR